MHDVEQQPSSTDRWVRWGGAALGVISIAVIIVGLFTSKPPEVTTNAQGTPLTGPHVGNFAPDFTLNDLTGTDVHLADLRGHPVVLNFWYVACPGCQQEAPALTKGYLAHESQGLIVLGVNTADLPPDARTFAHVHAVSYPIVLDTHERVVSLYQITAAPTSIFIDAQGIIREAFAGILDDASFSQALALIGVN